MNKLKYRGIPYLGEDTQIKYGFIRDADYTELRTVTILEFFTNKEQNRYICLIQGYWLTWLDDIQFNYRDGCIRLPFFTYETKKSEIKFNGEDRSNVLLDDDNIVVTYNYELNLLAVNEMSKLKIFDTKTGESFRLKFSGYTDNTTFSMSDVKKLYAVSCYFDDKSISSNYEKGYHYITEQFKGFINYDYSTRLKLKLSSYKDDYKPVLEDYRDVRNYEYDKYILTVGNEYFDSRIYKYRRLDFDCMLFCIIKGNLICSDDDNYNNFLRGSLDYYKVSFSSLNLIFKKYWYSKDNNKNSLIYKRFMN